MNQLTVDSMKVGGRVCPLGLDSLNPTFSWSFKAPAERSRLQTAYRILVSTLQAGSEEIWDSGRVESGKCTDVKYAGAPLQSAKRYYWQVTVWDQDGQPSSSAVSWWETGLLRTGDWTAQWIGEPGYDVAVAGSSLPEAGKGADGTLRPMPQFRREFEVRGPVRSARAYISGLGHYELRLNGAKVGDHVMDPGWTDYNITCLYTVYDITEQVKEGMNAAGFLLGNGFYNVVGGRYTKFKDSYGQPKCRLQIELNYADGTTERIITDRNWLTSPSPIVFSCMYGGEDYDARLEQPGWDRPGFTPDGRWTNAVVVEAPAGTLKAQSAPALKVMKRFAPAQVTEPRPGVYVIDLGQNFSGWVSITVSGSSGAAVTLTPGERLTDGLPDQKFSGSPYKYTYTLRGEEQEEWTPRFSYYGFRYVQVEGAVPRLSCAESAQREDGKEDTAHQSPVLLALEGQMIYPDTKTAGGFECSDPMLNRIHEIINWAILSNMKSVFTDCPHREKLGWLEELHLMGPAIIYNYDVHAQLTKVMGDMRDAQLPNGMVPTTAPEYVVFVEPWDMFRNSVPWGGAYILVGWDMFRKYGDRSILENHYDGMVRYIDYITVSSNDLIVENGLGDWYDVGPNGPGFAQNTPVPLVETAFYYHLLTVMQEISARLGRLDESKRLRELGEMVRRKFNATFFDRQVQYYSTGSQAAQAVPLAFGLVPEEHCDAVFRKLTDDIIANGFYTTAGDIGHRYVLMVLARYGRTDLIYRMAVNTEKPSYGYQIVHGATSLTEAWDGPTVGKSQNHLMLGHLEEYLYAGFAGLDYRYDPQTERFELAVKPGVIDDLSRAAVWHELSPGRAEVCWERSEEGSLKLEVLIPANTHAVIHVPALSAKAVKELGGSSDERHQPQLLRYEQGTAVFRVGSGQYTFISEGVCSNVPLPETC